ncbi:hypothetical protein Hanom_Chr16g01491801 [Helianthus anomalus]
MASNKNDMLVQFSKLTESEIDKFCLDHGIDPSLDQTQVLGERTANQYPQGFLVFYTQILDQSNLRYPFTNFFLEPKVHELERELLLRLRAYRTKLRAYPEGLLVVLGISQDCFDSCFESVFFVDQKEMSALDYMLLNDPPGVEIEQKDIPEGGPSIVLYTKHVRTAVDLESVPIQPIVDNSFTKKQLVPIHRSTSGASSPNVAP